MEATRTNKTPAIANWSEVSRWDYKSARAAIFAIRNPTLRRLGEFADEATELIDPRYSPDKEWPVYGVNNESGVFLNKLQIGSAFNSQYKKIREDYFFHNPTRANVGSLGRVRGVSEDAITSPEYQVWKLRPGLLPAFAEILIKTDFFLDQVECHRVGGVKERLFVKNLLEIPVPIPPLNIQRKIVDYSESAQASIASLKNQVAEIENKMMAQFLADLGLQNPIRRILLKGFTAQWNNFERWSVSYNQAAMSIIDLSRGKYPPVDLGSILEMIQYGSSEKANTKGEGSPVLRIKNVKNGRIDVTELKHIHLGKKTLSGLSLVDGDILIIRTSGSRDLVGTCAVFHEKGEFVFASYLIRLRPYSEVALPEFIAYYLNSPIGRRQVDTLSRHIMQNNINSQELRSVRLPLPPIETQKKIVARIKMGQDEIVRQSESVNRLQIQTRANIEKMILGTSPDEVK